MLHRRTCQARTILSQRAWTMALFIPGGNWMDDYAAEGCSVDEHREALPRHPFQEYYLGLPRIIHPGIEHLLKIWVWKLTIILWIFASKSKNMSNPAQLYLHVLQENPSGYAAFTALSHTVNVSNRLFYVRSDSNWLSSSGWHSSSHREPHFKLIILMQTLSHNHPSTIEAIFFYKYWK